MTSKELIAEIKTIAKLSSDSSIRAICDILIDIVKTVEEKKSIGFGDRKL